MGFWSDLGSNISDTAGEFWDYGQNVVGDYLSPENIFESGLYTLLAGGNRGDYFRNAGLNSLLRNFPGYGDPRQSGRQSSQVQQQLNPNLKGPPVAGSRGPSVMASYSPGGIGDYLAQTATFEEGEDIQSIPMGQNIRFGDDRKKSGILGNMFGGGNQGSRGGYDMSDIIFDDRPIVNQSTGEIVGYQRHYSTGAIEQLDENKNMIGAAGKYIQRPRQTPAYFGRGTGGLLSDIGQYGMGARVNQLLLERLFPDQFRTKREAQELADADYMRQVGESEERLGTNQLFANMMSRRNMAKGGIAKLAQGGFPRKTGSIAGPGTEKSDSIPAMLSDGEFVMTSEAVKNAGNGSREKGTKKMYALMDSLESVGKM